MPAKGEHGEWLRPLQVLRLWFKVYLALWLGGIIFILLGAKTGGSIGRTLFFIGLPLFVASLAPYVVGVVYLYRVMKALHTSGVIRLHPHYNKGFISYGPWYVVAASLLLNPYVLGFIPLWSVTHISKSIAEERGLL